MLGNRACDPRVERRHAGQLQWALNFQTHELVYILSAVKKLGKIQEQRESTFLTILNLVPLCTVHCSQSIKR